jgi:two-component system cell cycle sensor histidine kinase/response regulator CckA
MKQLHVNKELLAGRPLDDPILEMLPVGIMILTQDGSVRLLNAAGLGSIEAQSLDQIKGKPFLPIIAPEFRSAFLSLFRNVLAGNTDSLEYQITGMRGTRRWLEMQAVPFSDPSSEKLSMLAVIRDTTERVQREGRNRYFQKMDAIATLTSNVAHDFNNILTSIVGYANILKRKLPADDILQPMTAQILASTDRAAALTKNLLSFGSKQILDLRPTRLDDVIRTFLDTLQQDLGSGIRLSYTGGAPDDITIMVDQNQIMQAFQHILWNARDAMPAGGAIGITTQIMELEDTFISIHGYGTKGSYAVLAFTDTGTGMNDQVRRKAFEPFFTTKEFGRGLGLGLAIVYGTIKSHKGFVNIYSEPGMGTTVRVYLPVSEIRRSSQNDEFGAIPAGKGETILLAEDDQHVRNITISILEQFGYKVVPAATGGEAWDLFRRDPGSFALLMIDMILPVLSGVQVYDAVLKVRPDVKVLFTSGHTPDLLKAKGLSREGVPFIAKPVSPRDLLHKIREVLEP